MNIQKPQKILFKINSIENLQNLEKEINEVDGKIENKIIEHQNLENIEIYDFEFKVVKFSKCNIMNSKLEKITFMDVIFDNCNFSNTSFQASSFIRCEFINCKLSGCDFTETIQNNVIYKETNAGYSNFSLSRLNNILFDDTILRNAYFQEDIFKNVYFQKADLVQAQFFKTSLKNIDLSSSFIDGIVISLEDIKGAIINEYQAINLIGLLGVKIKEQLKLQKLDKFDIM